MGTDDSTISDLIDDESESIATAASDSCDKLLKQDKNEEAYIDLLKSRLKHLFILSENGKPVFTRFILII
jgi:hypothetical protein